MQKPENLEKRERMYYKGCMVLVIVFECLAGLAALLSVVDLARTAAAPPDAAVVEEIRGTLYFSVTMTYSYTPVGGHIPENFNPKVFETAWIAVQLFAGQIPYLIFFGAIRRMLREIGAGHSPLNPGAVRYIRTAGAALVFLSVCEGLIEQLVMGAVIYGRAVISNPFSILGLFGGLLILLFAGIYRRGCLLQQEADETI